MPRTPRGPVAYLVHEYEHLDLDPAASGFAVVIYGHTHVREERKQGKALIVNPGTASGYMRDEATAMICDLDGMAISTIKLD